MCGTLHRSHVRRYWEANSEGEKLFEKGNVGKWVYIQLCWSSKLDEEVHKSKEFA